MKEFNGSDLAQAFGTKTSILLQKSLHNFGIPHRQKQLYINDKLNVVNVYEFEPAMEAFKTRVPRTKVEKLAWRRNYGLLKTLHQNLQNMRRN